jgi:hypothetical protein
MIYEIFNYHQFFFWLCLSFTRERCVLSRLMCLKWTNGYIFCFFAFDELRCFFFDINFLFSSIIASVDGRNISFRMSANGVEIFVQKKLSLTFFARKMIFIITQNNLKLYSIIFVDKIDKVFLFLILKPF